MSQRFSRLTVLWNDPESGSRFPIGGLLRDSAGYAFFYAAQLATPQSKGFLLPPEFPEHRDEATPYRSRYLFSTFAQRVPSPKRPDRKALLDTWGVEDRDDPMEILARSGGIQMTDRLELSEFRSDDDDLLRPLEFRVAGEKHYSGAAQLSPGVEVELVRDAANQFDRCATLVRLAGRAEAVGFVPRQYSPLFARLLDGGVLLTARVVRRLVVPDDRGKWVVEAVRSDSER